MKSFTTMAFIGAVLSSLPSTFAAPPGSAGSAAKAMSSVPAPELPAKASELVARASATERNAVAAAVLQAVSQRNPGSVGVVASTLARTSPGLPAVAAHAGAGTTPNENSRFDEAPPHGGNPPGLNGQPGRQGPPAFVDYSKPRPF